MSRDDRPSPISRTSREDDAGRVCPYCRFALKEGGELTECGSCHAPHHTDCWNDNGGCAVLGCASAPLTGAPAPAPRPAAPPMAPGGPSPPPPRPPQAVGGATPQARPPASGGPWSSRGVVAAVLALALAIAGAGVAVVVTNKKDNTPGPGASASPPPPPSSGGSPTPPPSPQPPPGPISLLPDTDRGTMESDITSVLLAHHRAIVNGDYYAAWVLTSQRYRAKKVRELGSFEQWAAGQRATAKYLDPDGLEVSIQQLDPASGVATVMVTGMHWTDPSSGCSKFDGITWAKYENDHWRYEPGYSISDQRREKWRSRAGELLGVACVGL